MGRGKNNSKAQQPWQLTRHKTSRKAITYNVQVNKFATKAQNKKKHAQAHTHKKDPHNLPRQRPGTRTIARCNNNTFEINFSFRSRSPPLSHFQSVKKKMYPYPVGIIRNVVNHHICFMWCNIYFMWCNP